MASLPREAKTSEFGPCQPIPQLCHHLWEQHIPVRAAQGRRGDGPWEWQDGESVWAQSFGAAGGEKEGKESSVQSRVWKRPLERKVSPWSLFEFQDRKRKGTLEFPGQAKQVVPQTQNPTMGNLPRGPAGSTRDRGTPSRDSPSLSARTCPQWDTSPLPPRGSTTARPRG